MQNIACTKPLILKGQYYEPALYFPCNLEKCSDDIQTIKKKWRLKETGQGSDQNFVCSDNPRQDIWNKIEKSSKSGKDKKSWISTSVCFLAVTPKFNFWKGVQALRYVSTQI